MSKVEKIILRFLIGLAAVWSVGAAILLCALIAKAGGATIVFFTIIVLLCYATGTLLEKRQKND